MEFNLIIDDEFKRLCPTLTSEECQRLELDLLDNFEYPTIEVWNNIILYDFYIYEISKSMNSKIYIKKMTFESRKDALLYACKKNYYKENIPSIYRRYLIGKGFNCIKSILKDVYKHRRSSPFDESAYTKEDYKKGKSRIAVICATEFNVTSGTTRFYSTYSVAIDTIYSMDPTIASELMGSKFVLSIEHTVALSKMTVDELRVAYNHAKEYDNYSLLNKRKKPVNDLNNVIPTPVIPKRNRKKVEPVIKQVPQYDPDAELSSLALTIPTWISSMNRAIKNADLENASLRAKWKLFQCLNDMKSTIDAVQTKLEGEPLK